ncbi:MAG TPA: prepilin-type N-terminal cleavage/methylation domain-containing protein [Candidatus Limnocylindria bacterium]|nr:prepilin-type N-terminal cleavage/methylation domain-containing protein [Candidatus Limnocylindria bacterium]
MRSRRPAGFTLLEVALALAILGAGVVTCLQIFSASLQLQDRASRQTRVVLLARAGMDGMLTRQDLSNSSVTLPTDEQGFTTRLDVEDALPEDGFTLPEGLDPNSVSLVPKRLTVTVTWQDASGPKEYVLRTLRLVPREEF